MFDKVRAKIAEAISPSKPVESGGVERFVVVRWMVPGLGRQVEIYDRENKGDMAAWRENQALYPLQIIGYGATREVFADIEQEGRNDG